MTRTVFECRDTDAAGRIGSLTVPRAGVTVETPALLPVVNPNLQQIEPGTLADEFGAEILITNAYVVHQTDALRDEALERGLHDLLDFSGAIMTDSGSFQLAEYGAIDVTSREILEFQRAIGSDIATPVDIPTPPDADREQAERDLETTRERLDAASSSFDPGEMLCSAPIQGSTYADLREAAARHAYGTGLDVFPIGAVVPLLNGYRFAETVDVIAAAKRGLGADAPVHLFGAGHPMMFALAVAMGCDLFDSAAYALYARDDRYLTLRGTEQLSDLTYFPCSCPVCVGWTPDELRSAPASERERLLSRHNLHVTYAEMRTIKEAIRAGDLLELVETRARAHPTMLDGYRALVSHSPQLERSEPATKRRPFFYLSTESADRPEVYRHHRRLSRLSCPDRLLLVDVSGVDRDADPRRWTDGIDPDELAVVVDHDAVDPNVADDDATDPDVADQDVADNDATDHDAANHDATIHDLADNDATGLDAADYDDCWYVLAPFGPIPPALLETYPLSAELPQRTDATAYERAATGVAALCEANPALDVALVHRNWPATALALLPDTVEATPLREDSA